MEKNYVTMAREVEKLRAELLNNSGVDRRTGGSYYGNPVPNESEASGHSAGQNAYEESYGVGDSNAMILPSKKKRKRNQEGKIPGTIKTAPKLTKSQKKKLQKLEEDKEKAFLLSKSIDALGKYKLPEDTYSLLQSSKDIGQVESKKEKCRKAVLFSKAGLEVPYTDRPFKKKDDVHACSESEPELERTQLRKDVEKSDQVQSMLIKKEIQKTTSVSLNSSKGLVYSRGHVTDAGPATPSPSKNVICKEHDVSLPENTASSVNDDHERTESMDRVKGTPEVTSSRTSEFSVPAPRSLITPTIVHVSRPAEVENTRKDLPIVMMEQEIMEAVNDHSTVIICGETGCGKTTQVPQFLFEAGFGSNHSCHRSGIIGVTQPRRVAVLATARRVAYELGLCLGKEVGFQVRFDKKIGESSSIKFMTDGILLRELQSDFLLKRYSVIVLDEAHERSLNTDILIGMLSRVIIVRQQIYAQQQSNQLLGKAIDPGQQVFPLKLVLMSATLRVEDFISGRKLFRDIPPVIEVPTRQFPVTTHFSKRTGTDYIGQAYKKVLAIHKRLPCGGILVFVTGQREVESLCRKLRKASRELFMKKSGRKIGYYATESSKINVGLPDMNEIKEAFEVDENSADHQFDRFSSVDEDPGSKYDDESDASYDSETESEVEIVDDDGDLLINNSLEIDGVGADVLGEMASIASLKAAFEALAGKTELNSSSDGKQTISDTLDACCNKPHPCLEKKSEVDIDKSPGGLHVLPLYAMLPAASQLRVFEEVKEGDRLVVVATNVAETSLTIPGVKYVVDTGRVKVKNYNSSNGMATYNIEWISKASAAQRQGRAGRTGPGHCYRLYSSAVYNNEFPDFSPAEILKVPIDGVVILMKSMNIDKVSNFPFPTPPDVTALDEAERCLKALEALDSNGRLTPLGKAMARYPMGPRLSRMLLTVIQIMYKEKSYSRSGLVLAYAVAAVAALNLSNPFVRQFENDSNNHDPSAPVDNKDLEKEEKLRRKKLKESVKVFREKFCNPISDALSVAFALQCYELSGSPVKFCNDNALHPKTMEEMSKLRKQLLQLLFSQCGVAGSEKDFSCIFGSLEDVEHVWRVSHDKSPLSLYEEDLLRQAICAGWADRVAKRIRGTTGFSEVDRKVHAVRYQACMVEETVFLDRWSSVSNAAPEFLVYTELTQTRRLYMHGLTSVKPEWLVRYAPSLCTLSTSTDAKEYYDPVTDQVLHDVIPTFGPHLWKLPPHSLPITNHVSRVAVFAYALLEGQVLPCLRHARGFMKAPPASILRPEAEGQRRAGNLLAKLKKKKIDSCAMLREVWKENPNELHSEIQDWFKDSFRKNFGALWSDMLREVALEPKERFS